MGEAGSSGGFFFSPGRIKVIAEFGKRSNVITLHGDHVGSCSVFPNPFVLRKIRICSSPENLGVFQKNLRRALGAVLPNRMETPIRRLCQQLCFDTMELHPFLNCQILHSHVDGLLECSWPSRSAAMVSLW